MIYHINLGTEPSMGSICLLLWKFRSIRIRQTTRRRLHVIFLLPPISSAVVFQNTMLGKVGHANLSISDIQSIPNICLKKARPKARLADITNN